MRFLILNGWAGYAPYEKRIRSLTRHAGSVLTLSVERNLVLGLPRAVPDDSLGAFRKGDYLARLAPLLNSVRRVRGAARQADLVYALGFEMGALAVLSCAGLRRRPRIVYEMHDVRDVVLGSSAASRCLRWVESVIVNRVDLLVVTSRSYLTNYYDAFLSRCHTPAQIIENKVHSDDHPPRDRILPYRQERFREHTLVIGYFGSLRCPVTWSILKRIALAGGGRVRVYLRGIPLGLESFDEDVRHIDALEYGGPYRDPEDLAEIYGRVDVVWAAGFYGKRNYQWSRCCRFYYACYYKRPLIACAESDDGRAVVGLGVGTVIDLNDPERAIRTILAIDDEILGGWSRNLSDLSHDAFCYTDEDQRLIQTATRNCTDRAAAPARTTTRGGRSS